MAWTPGRPGQGGASLELAVLEALARGVGSAPALVSSTGASPDDVQRVLRWAVEHDLVTPVSPYRLTDGGRGALTFGQLRGSGGGLDVARVARKVGEVTQHARHGRDLVRERREAPILIEPGARESAVDWLNLQYVRGVLDDDDRDRRVGLALAARTRGDLAHAMSDLPQPVAPSRTAAVSTAAHELSRTLFAVAAVVGSVTVALVVVVVLVLLLRG